MLFFFYRSQCISHSFMHTHMCVLIWQPHCDIKLFLFHEDLLLRMFVWGPQGQFECIRIIILTPEDIFDFVNQHLSSSFLSKTSRDGNQTLNHLPLTDTDVICHPGCCSVISNLHRCVLVSRCETREAEMLVSVNGQQR